MGKKVNKKTILDDAVERGEIVGKVYDPVCETMGGIPRNMDLPWYRQSKYVSVGTFGEIDVINRPKKIK